MKKENCSRCITGKAVQNIIEEKDLQRATEIVMEICQDGCRQMTIIRLALEEKKEKFIQELTSS